MMDWKKVESIERIIHGQAFEIEICQSGDDGDKQPYTLTHRVTAMWTRKNDHYATFQEAHDAALKYMNGYEQLIKAIRSVILAHNSDAS